MAFTDDQLAAISGGPSTPQPYQFNGLQVPQEQPKDPKEIEDDIAFYSLTDVARGAAAAGAKAVYDVYATGVDFMEYAGLLEEESRAFSQVIEESESDALKFFFETQTTSGAMTREVGAFIVGMIGVGKFTKALGIFGSAKDASRGAKIGKAMVDGAIADFMVSDPEAPRLADFLPESLQNPVSEYLSYDPEADEERLGARLKNSVEGVLLGTAMEGAMSMFRHYRKVLHANVANSSQHKNMMELLTGFKETGSVSPTPFHDMPASAWENVDESVRAAHAAERAARESINTEVVENFFKTLDDEEFLTNREFLARADQLLDKIGFDDVILTKNLVTELAARSNVIAKKARLELGEAFVHESPENVYKQIVEGLTENPDDYIAMYAKNNDVGGLPVLAALGSKVLKQTSTDMMQSIKGWISNPTASNKRQLAEAVEKHLTMIPILYDPASIAGRTLRASGVGADSLAKAAGKDFAELNVERTVKMWEKFDAAFKGSDKELNDFVSALIKTDGKISQIEKALTKKQWGFLDRLIQFRMINLLSGVSTQSVNTIGTASNLLLQDVVERTTATGISSMSFGGKTLFGSVGMAEQASARSLAGAMKGLMTGVTDYFKAFSDNVKVHGGIVPGIKKRGFIGLLDDAGVEKYNKAMFEGAGGNAMLIEPKHAMTKPLAELWNMYAKASHGVVFGTMNLVDSTFKSGSFRAAVDEQAIQLGLAAGKSGTQLDTYVKNLSKLALQYSKDPQGAEIILRQSVKDSAELARAMKLVEKLHDTGIKAARSTTFQNELSGRFSQLIEKALNDDNSVSKLTKAFVTPFVRTPLNIVSATLDRTPGLNLLRKHMRNDLLGKNGRAAATRAMAKMASGMMLYTGAAHLVATRMVTGGHRKEDRDRLNLEGIPEYSIFLPESGTWVSYKKTDPLGMYLGTVADVMNHVNDLEPGEYDKFVSALMLAGTQNLFNKTYLKGVSDIFMAVSDPTRFRDTYLKGQIGTLTPMAMGLKSIDAIFDPGYEETKDLNLSSLRDAMDTIMDTALKDIPFSNRVNKTDVLGRNMERPGGWRHMVAEMAGFRTRKPSDSPFIQQLSYYNITHRNKPGALYGRVKMDQEQFRRQKQILNTDLDVIKHGEAFVASPGYQALDHAGKKKALRNWINASRRTAKDMLIQEDPEVLKAVRENAFRGEQFLEKFEGPPTQRPKDKQNLLEVMNQIIRGPVERNPTEE